MKMTVLFNTQAAEDDFSIGWGLSFLINEHLLFDTGERGDFLFHNMGKLKIDPRQIDTVVISHDHWDHTGGLWELLKAKEGIIVYSCPGFSAEFKAEVKKLKGNLQERKNFFQISDQLFLTGELSGTFNDLPLPEQALVCKTNQGVTVLTGCAHPGLLTIMEQVVEHFPRERIYSVLGGFHLEGFETGKTESIINRLQEMGVKKVGPTHCTGVNEEEMFRKAFVGNCLSIKVGQVIEV